MQRPEPTAGPLDAMIARHRVYFEVARETVRRGEERITVALRVLLWAVVPKGEGSLPASPGCRAAVAALSATADAAIARAGLDPAPDVETFQWALYASRQEPDADEVRLGVNLRAPPGANGPEGTARERALGRLRGALEELGVFEGGWRKRPTDERGAEPASTAPREAARERGEVVGGRLVPAHA